MQRLLAEVQFRDPARARRLIADEGLDNLSLEAVGWLLPVLSGDKSSTAEVEAIRRLLNNRAEETAATAHFTTSYADDYLLLNSDRRTDAVILDALITDRPDIARIALADAGCELPPSRRMEEVGRG